MTKIIFQNIHSLSLNSDHKNILFCDKNFYEIHHQNLQPFLNCFTQVFVCRSGEENKNWSYIGQLAEEVLTLNISRDDQLWAMGGGALSDAIGFLSSILLRGLSWNVIPTTLLSIVDASLGGKTAVNSQWGKNLIGSFHFPQTIYVDPSFLSSLPQKEILSGWGEIIKYAFLDSKINQKLRGILHYSEILQDCLAFKQKITLEDPYEKGPRIFLNLGHTFAHPLERRYELPHGQAVLWGMEIVFKLFGCQESLHDLNHFIQKFQLKSSLDIDFRQNELLALLDEMKKDKKNKNDYIQMVLPHKIQRVSFVKLKGLICENYA